ncbi:MAG: energy transducer TonB [Bacteroidota bacterium]
MPLPIRPSRPHRSRYHVRVLGCMVGSLALVLGLFRFWPLPSDDVDDGLTFDTRSQDIIAMEEITPTRQTQRRAPPPPAPLPPIVVPDDIELEEPIIEITDSALPIDNPGTDADLQEGDSDKDSGPPAPMTSPKLFRFVEPNYTDAARRRGIRAEVALEVLVNERGRVEEAKIVQRYLLGKNPDDKEAVTELGYGLEEAALEAARRFGFRPARQGGKAVRSYTTFSLSFGV